MAVAGGALFWLLVGGNGSGWQKSEAEDDGDAQTSQAVVSNVHRMGRAAIKFMLVDGIEHFFVC